MSLFAISSERWKASPKSKYSPECWSLKERSLLHLQLFASQQVWFFCPHSCCACSSNLAVVSVMIKMKHWQKNSVEVWAWCCFWLAVLHWFFIATTKRQLQTLDRSWYLKSSSPRFRRKIWKNLRPLFFHIGTNRLVTSQLLIRISTPASCPIILLLCKTRISPLKKLPPENSRIILPFTTIIIIKNELKLAQVSHRIILPLCKFRKGTRSQDQVTTVRLVTSFLSLGLLFNLFKLHRIVSGRGDYEFLPGARITALCVRAQK